MAHRRSKAAPLSELLSFTKLLNKFSTIERTIHIKNREHRETDSEHSFQLAITAWYLITTDKLKLDTTLAVKYALAHDLVEAYAGDTPFFKRSSTKNLHSTKKYREEQAALRLKKEFPKFKELHSLISNYEKRKDPESVFVYALDKVVPVFNIYLDGGRTWKKHHISFDELVSSKNQKVAESAEIKKYFDELTVLLNKNIKRLFN